MIADVSVRKKIFWFSSNACAVGDQKKLEIFQTSAMRCVCVCRRGAEVQCQSKHPGTVDNAVYKKKNPLLSSSMVCAF